MSTLQKFVVLLLPKKWAESMEAESRAWIARCSCGFERSFWDTGGIRWKAAGNERRILFCPYCGKSCWHTLCKKSAATV